jgi:hypothetical protein
MFRHGGLGGAINFHQVSQRLLTNFLPDGWTARWKVFFAALAGRVRGTATNSPVDGIVGLILNVRQPHARGSPSSFFRKINPTNRIS